MDAPTQTDVIEVEAPIESPPSPPPPLSAYLYPGSIHLLTGSPYAGKSTLLASLMATLHEGQGQWLSFQRDVNFADVYLVLLDRGRNDNRRWLEEYGLDKWLEGKIFSAIEDSDYIKAYRENVFRDAAHPGVAEFEFILSKLNPKPGSLIVLDVFTNAITGDVGTGNWRSLRGHMVLLQHIAHARHLTILGTGYGNKIRPDTIYRRGTDNATGQRPFFGALSTHMHLMSPEEQEQPFHTLYVKGRNAPDLEIYLKRATNGRFEVTVPDVEQAVENIQKRQGKDGQAKARILGVMKGRMTVKEIVELTALSRGTVGRCLSEMVETGEVVWVERGRYERVEAS